MARKKKEEEVQETVYPRIILGLDVSTACIGISIIEDDGVSEQPKIIAITHKSPKVSGKIKGIEALCIRKSIFDEGFLKCISEYTDKKITDVIIEEPLLSSNNVNTVATLLRFNGMIADAVYNTLGIVPNFISSYDARIYSFPELVSLRKYNKKGEEYPLKHIKDAIKKDNIVLFGSYPFDIDKKSVMMNMVNERYFGENAIPWEYDAKGELKKQNYDACDALICALAFFNINRYGIEKPTISYHSITTANSAENNEEETIVNYTTKIWGKAYPKSLRLKSKS